MRLTLTATATSAGLISLLTLVLHVQPNGTPTPSATPDPTARILPQAPPSGPEGTVQICVR